MLRFWFLLLGFAAAAPANSAPEQKGTPSVALALSDEAFNRQVSEILSAVRVESLQKLDALARNQGLTPQQRLIVTGLQVRALNGQEKHAEARALADAVVKSFPENYQSHLILAEAAHLQDDFGASAEALMQASYGRPDVVNDFDVYAIMLTVHRLESAGDHDLATRFAQRLFDAGWDKGSVYLRSTMALDVIENLVAEGDSVSAGRYLPFVTSPSTFATLLTETRYADLRKAAEIWGGVRLEKQWPIYLETTRKAWLKQQTPEAAQDYVLALDLAGHDRTIVSTFQPVFSRRLDPVKDDLWVFLVRPIAHSLARLGRWDEAFDLFDRASLLWPPGSSANAINISANRAKLHLLKGNFEKSLKLWDDVLHEAARVADEVTPKTMAVFETYRACARFRVGYGDAVADAERIAGLWASREPMAVAWMQLCIGKRDQALATWIGALENEESRTDVIAFAQPDTSQSVDSAFGRDLHEQEQALSSDPALNHAVRKYGERRKWAIRHSAPKE